MTELKDLHHITKTIEGTHSGEVIVLNTGATINSEAEAMLQALHSRSTGGLKHHLEILEKRGADKFMSNFYVGYGHKSIGDCGSITIFVEGVSMLAAKAIQQQKLYSGQEASTRYIDFSKQLFIDPTHSELGNEILEMQREFYLSALEPTIEKLKIDHPIQDGEKETVYDKAINARAFDITRGFLPAGASTNLAWHSNLRQISDHLLFLRHHPLQEVRNIADAVEQAVLEYTPSSFTTKRYELTEKYQDEIAKYYYYNHNDNSHENLAEIELSCDIDEDELIKYRDLINSRPPKTELPQFVSFTGDIKAKFLLDFGSFRDLQRHRGIDQKMPLLTTQYGFHEWYLQELPENIRVQAIEHLEKLQKKIEEIESKFNMSREELQYFIPMGYNISNQIRGNLTSMIYMVELRATRFVHPTLRDVAKQIGEYIQNQVGVKIHLDVESDRFDVKRGEHDISLK